MTNDKDERSRIGLSSASDNKTGFQLWPVLLWLLLMVALFFGYRQLTSSGPFQPTEETLQVEERDFRTLIDDFISGTFVEAEEDGPWLIVTLDDGTMYRTRWPQTPEAMLELIGLGPVPSLREQIERYFGHVLIFRGLLVGIATAIYGVVSLRQRTQAGDDVAG